MKQLALLFVVAAGAAFCQDQPDRVNVPFSDPSRPKMLRASVLNGSIIVKGYNGKEAIVEARGEGSKHKRDRGDRADGMHRIDIGGSGLSVEESDNVVTVGTRSMNENVEINIQVPFDTSLKLHDVNGGEISVDHINGDVEIDVTNGRATATHISGSAIVHALNDRVLVTLDKVTADKPMSFSSLNGDIDVTLPADLKAKVKLKRSSSPPSTETFISGKRSSKPASPLHAVRTGNYSFLTAFYFLYQSIKAKD
jgi:hypothetical protein